MTQKNRIVKNKKEKIIYLTILVVLLSFVCIQVYESSKPIIMVDSAITSDGEYIYVDMSKQPLRCDWNDKIQNVENCIDVSTNEICKYNLDYTFTGECWDK